MSVLNEDAALVRATESITQMYYGITAQSSYLKKRSSSFIKNSFHLTKTVMLDLMIFFCRAIKYQDRNIR